MFFIDDELLDDQYKIDLENNLNKIVNYFNNSGNFSVSFISDEEIKELNKEYRNLDNSTDILTFALKEDDSVFPSFPEEEDELGDIYISIDSMERNSLTFGVEKKEELARLLLHGYMHLLGYDHETNDFNKEEMLIKQEEILSQLGLKK